MRRPNANILYPLALRRSNRCVYLLPGEGRAMIQLLLLELQASAIAYKSEHHVSNLHVVSSERLLKLCTNSFRTYRKYRRKLARSSRRAAFVVEGEALAKRLERGALPLKEALKYGTQIADALDKAHRSGVIHRDVKPGNIMLTPTGAKLLDFGGTMLPPSSSAMDLFLHEGETKAGKKKARSRGLSWPACPNNKR